MHANALQFSPWSHDNGIFICIIEHVGWIFLPGIRRAIQGLGN